MSTAAVAEQATLLSIYDVLAWLLSYRVQDINARIISSLPIREDPQVDVAAVTFEKGHHSFLVNPNWVHDRLQEGKAGLDQIRAVIAHEALHVVELHIGRQMRLYKGISTDEEKARFRRFSNVAADLAVNTLLLAEQDALAPGRPAYRAFQTDPDFGLRPAQYGMPEELSYEWYLHLLMNRDECTECAKIEFQKGKKPDPCPHGHGKGRGNGKSKGDYPVMGDFPVRVDGKDSPTSNHDKHWVEVFDTLTEEEKDLLVDDIKLDARDILERAINEQRKSRGTVPARLEKKLADLLRPTPVPWKRLLNQFVTRSRQSKLMRSLERPRKRWINLGTTLYPGTKRDKTYHLAFLVDVSGSMSDADVATGLEELQAILRINPDMQVTVGQFDTDMAEEPKVFTPRDDPKTFVRKRDGGTDFNAAFRVAQALEKKGKIDALIIFTDGYAPQPVTESRPRNIPVLWCLTEGGQHPCPGYGYEIRRKQQL